MKLRSLPVSLALLATVAGRVLAAPAPNTIGFMGLLNSAAGQHQNGTVTLTLALYTVPTGGTPAWSEQQSVTATNGLFTAALGSSTPFPSSVDFSQAYYVGVTVQGDSNELTPRIPLQGLPYAMFAQSVADGAVTSSKLASDAASLSKVTGGAMTAAGGNIGIGTASPASVLTVANNTNNSSIVTIDSGHTASQYSAIDLRDAGIAKWGLGKNPDNAFYLDESGVGNRVTVLPGGNVGIGTASPAAKLDVNGTAKMAGFQLGSSTTAGNVLIGNAAGAGSWSSGISVGSGKVGIGTTTPLSELTVAKKADLGSEISIDSGVAASQFSSVDFYDRGTAKWGIGKNTADDFYVAESGVANRLYVKAGGNVGIGTSAPASTLDVRGDIKLSANGGLYALGGLDNVRVIRGRIRGSDGVPTVGSGFSCSHVGPGDYKITYNTAFTDTPIVTATAITPHRQATVTMDNAYNGSVEIFFSANDNNIDAGYVDFIAIGAR